MTVHWEGRRGWESSGAAKRLVHGAQSTANHTSALLLPCEQPNAPIRPAASRPWFFETCNWKHQPNIVFVGLLKLLFWQACCCHEEIYWRLNYFDFIESSSTFIIFFFPIMLFWIDCIIGFSSQNHSAITNFFCFCSLRNAVVSFFNNKTVIHWRHQKVWRGASWLHKQTGFFCQFLG